MNKPAVQANVERANQWRARSKVRAHSAQTWVSLVIAVATFAAVAATVVSIARFMVQEGWAQGPVWIAGCIPALLALLVVGLAAQAARLSAKARTSADIYEARALGAKASEM